MVKFFKRRKLFDEDADWVPQKGRAFKMKAKMQKEETRDEPKKDQFRMTAEPPDIKNERTPFRMKVGQPDKKWEKTPECWTVEAVKNQTT